MNLSNWNRVAWMPVLVFALAGCRPPTPAGAMGGGNLPPVPVVGVEARLAPVVESISLIGTVAANEEIEVKSETDGVVQEILFEEGQPVDHGQLLVRLDETRLLAELADAEARLKLAESTYNRSRLLYEQRLISQQEYDQAASTFEVAQATVEVRRRQLKDARVYAPFPGRTGARTISPGQVITRNTPITWLVDLDPVKVEMHMPERFLSQTRMGQRVQFEVAAYPGRPFEGEIYFIAPRLDLDTRTALIKTRIPNPDGLLKAGMVASLQLNLTLREAAVLIPEVALLYQGDAAGVFVVGPDRKVALRPVVPGQRLPRWIEIVEGLQAGEWVVVEGHQKIGPGREVVLAPPDQGAVYARETGRP